ncbi:ankyrin [Stipitochalara longipes BDJ]|nr:ankyrin [Stipitochalara longipes BDJ]
MATASLTFRCAECQKNFPTATDRNRHRKKHDKAFHCAVCGRGFGLQSDVNRHTHTHLRDYKKDCSYKCLVPSCNFQGAARKDNLLKHLKKKHCSGALKLSEKEVQDYYDQAEAIRESSKVQAQEKNLKLLEAAYHGHGEKAKEAIFEGANLSTIDEQARTAAHIALDRGHTSLLKILMQAGIDLHHLLYRAVDRGNIEMVKTILDAGVEIDIEETYSTSPYFGLTRSPLTTASMLGLAAIVQILLDHGAKTDDPRQTESLFIHGHIDVVRILIAREHDINRRYGPYDATLLHIVAPNHAQLIPVLIERGFEINARDCYKRTPLSYSLAVPKFSYPVCYNKESANLLLDAGAEISTEDLVHMPSKLRAKVHWVVEEGMRYADAIILGRCF